MDDVEQAIRAALAGFDPCGTYHDLRVYREGEGWAISLHCLLDQDIPLRQAHALSSQVEEHLLNTVPRLCQVIVHIEPMARA